MTNLTDFRQAFLAASDADSAIKPPVRLAATVNITPIGIGQTIDGAVTAIGDRVLLTGQTDARQNGIRIVSDGIWPVASDFSNLVNGTLFTVTAGVSNAGQYSLTTANPIILGVTALTFASFWPPQWKTPPFNAANFLGGGGMVWTVSAGNLTTFRYYISGKIMVLNFQIENTSVGAPLANELAFRLPEGKSTPGFVGSSLGRLVDNGAPQVACYFSTSVSNTVLGINRLDQANFQSSVGLTSIYGQCIVEIN